MYAVHEELERLMRALGLLEDAFEQMAELAVCAAETAAIAPNEQTEAASISAGRPGRISLCCLLRQHTAATGT